MTLLREREFRNFWLAQSISLLGDQVAVLALPLVAVLVLDAGPGQMGLLGAAALFPHLLFSLPAGVWLDRVASRRRVMMAADLGRAALAATIPLAYALDALTLVQLYAVAFLSGSLAVLFDLSYPTLFVSLARRERYLEGNSLIHGSRSVSTVAGPSLGGLLVQAFSAPFALLADAASFLLSALFLGRVRAEEAPIEHQGERGLRDRVSVGLRFISGNPIFRTTLAAVATLNFFNYAFGALFVLYATRTLGVSAGTLGLVLGIGALGAVLGAVVAGRVGRAVGLGRAFVFGCVLFTAPLALVPLAEGPRWLVLSMLLTAEFLSGLGVMILDINVGSIMFALTPDRLRSRATGAFNFVNWGIRPLGALAGGALGAAIGIRPTLWVGVLGALAGVLWLLGSPVAGLRELPEEAA
jgi:MFS family permease